MLFGCLKYTEAKQIIICELAAENIVNRITISYLYYINNHLYVDIFFMFSFTKQHKLKGINFFSISRDRHTYKPPVELSI